MHASQTVLAAQTTHSLNHSLTADFNLDIFLESFKLLEAKTFTVPRIASSFETGQEAGCPTPANWLTRNWHLAPQALVSLDNIIVIHANSQNGYAPYIQFLQSLIFDVRYPYHKLL
jgi:hypothetical protein